MPKPQIAVLGSINMDLVIRCGHLPAPGQTIIADESLEIPGGKGANQAVSAARAGGRVTMIGRVGDDAFAGRLLEGLRSEDIETANVVTTTGCASGLAVVAVEASGENAIMVVPGSNGCVAPGDANAAAGVIQEADVLLLQLEIPLDTVIAGSSIAARAGVPVILDPAPMPSRLPDGILDVDVICPNRSEASAILGRPIETVDAARQSVVELHRWGARNAIITLGSDGAVVSNGSTVHWIEPFEVTAIDTTAAGDAFAGALAVRLARREPLLDAVRFAAAAGAIAATRLGAQVGMPDENEIKQLL